MYKNLFLLLFFYCCSVWADTPAISISETVIKRPLAEGVTLDDAAESMRLRANFLNMKMVGHLPLWKELESMGEVDGRRLEVFEFCHPGIARKMVDYDMSFLAYIPCRIGMIEDEQGQGWLVMLNLDLFINNQNMPTALQSLGLKVRNDLMNILEAGINGEL